MWGKDKKNCDKNNVIHIVKCEDCKVLSLGQTKRSFEIKKSEYLGRKSSVIYEHLQENKIHNFDWSHFNILEIEKIIGHSIMVNDHHAIK